MKNQVHQKLLGKVQVTIGVVAALAFFVCMSNFLMPYTFSEKKEIARLQACFAAVPITTTFWLAINMFMIVLADQRRQKVRVK